MDDEQGMLDQIAQAKAEVPKWPEELRAATERRTIDLRAARRRHRELRQTEVATWDERRLAQRQLQGAPADRQRPYDLTRQAGLRSNKRGE